MGLAFWVKLEERLPAQRLSRWILRVVLVKGEACGEVADSGRAR